MENQIKIFKQLQETSSRLGKEAIISENKDNKFFCQCLNFLLNPFITTGIDVKKWDKVSVSSGSGHTDDLAEEFLIVLEHVQTNNSGKISTVETVKGWCYKMGMKLRSSLEL